MKIKPKSITKLILLSFPRNFLNVIFKKIFLFYYERIGKFVKFIAKIQLRSKTNFIKFFSFSKVIFRLQNIEELLSSAFFLKNTFKYSHLKASSYRFHTSRKFLASSDIHRQINSTIQPQTHTRTIRRRRETDNDSVDSSNCPEEVDSPLDF